MTILEALGTEAVLEQLAEEASELSQAALKLARKLRGVNPTPKTEQECWNALLEEIADVQVAEEQLQLKGSQDFAIEEMVRAKTRRWKQRLLAREENNDESTYPGKPENP